MTIRILVTGFGGFPGAAKNPTAQLVAALAKRRSRFLRAGVHLEVITLPVVYAQIAARLSLVAQEMKPDVILHFGLAARRKTLCVETRALNRLSLLHYDAAGARAERRMIVLDAPPVEKSTLPCAVIVAALRRAGLRANLSIDAGDYVCNQTLFHSLSQNYAPLVGFIHTPRLGAGCVMSLENATRAAAVAILALAPKLRCQGARIASGAGVADKASKATLDPLPMLA